MKFGHLFEHHKIPEWYTEYIDYLALKTYITDFKSLRKAEKTRHLKGYYTINKKGRVYCIDFIHDFREKINQQKRD